MYTEKDNTTLNGLDPKNVTTASNGANPVEKGKLLKRAERWKKAKERLKIAGKVLLGTALAVGVIGGAAIGGGNYALKKFQASSDLGLAPVDRLRAATTMVSYDDFVDIYEKSFEECESMTSGGRYESKEVADCTRDKVSEHLAGLNVSINLNAKNIEDLFAKVTTLDGRTTTLEESYTKLDGRQNATEATVGKLEKKDKEQDETLKTHAASIQTNANETARVEKESKERYSDLAKEDTRIEKKVDDEAQGSKDRDEALGKRMDELETETDHKIEISQEETLKIVESYISGNNTALTEVLNELKDKYGLQQKDIEALKEELKYLKEVTVPLLQEAITDLATNQDEIKGELGDVKLSVGEILEKIDEILKRLDSLENAENPESYAECANAINELASAVAGVNVVMVDPSSYNERLEVSKKIRYSLGEAKEEYQGTVNDVTLRMKDITFTISSLNIGASILGVGMMSAAVVGLVAIINKRSLRDEKYDKTSKKYKVAKFIDDTLFGNKLFLKVRTKLEASLIKNFFNGMRDALKDLGYDFNIKTNSFSDDKQENHDRKKEVAVRTKSIGYNLVMSIFGKEKMKRSEGDIQKLIESADELDKTTLSSARSDDVKKEDTVKTSIVLPESTFTLKKSPSLPSLHEHEDDLESAGLRKVESTSALLSEDTHKDLLEDLEDSSEYLEGSSIYTDLTVSDKTAQPSKSRELSESDEYDLSKPIPNTTSLRRKEEAEKYRLTALPFSPRTSVAQNLAQDTVQTAPKVAIATAPQLETVEHTQEIVGAVDDNPRIADVEEALAAADAPNLQDRERRRAARRNKVVVAGK